MGGSSKTATAVIISDLHFTPATLDLAAVSLLRAQFKAKMLDVPLIIAGDTLDTKAVMRAECVNKLMRLLSVEDKPETYIMVGNHDMINEKGTDHSLQFLHGFANVVSSPVTIWLNDQQIMLVPYYSNVDKLKEVLQDEDTPKTLIMHQGVMGANMGHYVQDKTSLPPEAFDGFRVISGHYHRAQDIKCGKTGLFSYVGNPYTLSFGEANDGPKGFRVLYDDGSLESIPTNLRKHVIYEVTAYEFGKSFNINSEDLNWIKVRGTASELANIRPHGNYKLDLIPTDAAPIQIDTNRLTKAEILDTLIDATGETDAQRAVLKKLWRETIEAT